MTKLLREPLVHFLGAGLLVFLANALWTGGQDSDEQTILVSKAVLAQLDQTWLRTTGRQPSDEDRKGLINQYIEDEALAREARRLGLAEGDEIIKRRLAQKMRYMVADGDVDQKPPDRELKRWFEENRGNFNIAERRSFHHVYFSPERHGDNVENAAKQSLEELESGKPWKSLGDPFIQKRSYVSLPKNEVKRAFGPDFAKAIFALPKGKWSPPIGSAFGLHLVRIESIDSAAKADFEANKPRIREAYVEAALEANRRREIEDIVKGYDVVIAESD